MSITSHQNLLSLQTSKEKKFHLLNFKIMAFNKHIKLKDYGIRNW